MATFVLVHGAWHGGWCWQRVAPLLRSMGHEVVVPTLTGLGERSHLLSPEVGVSTHVADVLNTIRFERLSDIVLVGHSYAGMVLPGVAAQVPEIVRHVVFLDAFLPGDGQKLVDFVPPDLRAMFEGARDGIPSFPIEAFGLLDAASQDWVRDRITLQPQKTFLEPVRYDEKAFASLPRTYVYCTAPEMGPFAPFAAAVREKPDWTYQELAAGHDCMVTAPKELTDLLLKTAAGSRPKPAELAMAG